MSKVYLVNKHYNNREPYEDNYDYNEILEAFDSEEKAKSFIKEWMPENVFRTKEEAEEALKSDWDTLPEEEKDDGYYTGFEDFVNENACYIKKIEYNVKDSGFVKDVGWSDVIIPKVVTWCDKFYNEEPSVELTIKEMEVL